MLKDFLRKDNEIYLNKVKEEKRQERTNYQRESGTDEVKEAR